MPFSMSGRTVGLISLILFILTIPAGNWVVMNVGTVCPPDSPCLIPVWPGIMSPSAVLFAGLALILRERHLTLAIVLSGLVGSIVDSVIFLSLAFGSLDFIVGQVIGKFWMSLIAGAMIIMWRSTRRAQAA